MAGQLYELAYVSYAVRHMEQDDLNKLLEDARSNNHAQAISGMLLYAEGAFLQVLEGEQSRVQALYNQICADDRHAHAMVIHEGPISSRSFPDWKMGFRSLTEHDIERRSGFTDLLRAGSPAHKAFKRHPNKAHKLLMSFSECSAIIPSVDSSPQ